jgi:hypothetical protein
MGIIPQATISPPLIRGIEQHTVTKNPIFESVLIQFVLFYEHFGETAFFKDTLLLRSEFELFFEFMTIPKALGSLKRRYLISLKKYQQFFRLAKEIYNIGKLQISGAMLKLRCTFILKRVRGR